MEWTKIVRVCEGCQQAFRVSKEALQVALSQMDAEEMGPATTLEQVAEFLECCIGCVSGEPVEGEIVGPA